MSSSYSRKPVAWPRMQASSSPGDPAALVLGVQWINPLMWRDYPTQWNLLWSQGLAQPNANDKEAARFKLGDPVGQLTYGVPRSKRVEDYPNITLEYWSALRDLLYVPLRTFTPYAIDPNYFYSVRMGTDRPDYMDTRIFAGVSQQWVNTPTYFTGEGYKDLLREQEAMGIPAPSVLAYDAQHAEERMKDYWVTPHKDFFGKTVRGAAAVDEMFIGERTLSINAIRRYVFSVVATKANCRSMMLNPTGKLPTVTVLAGAETVGFYTLKEALQYIAENPTRLVWVWNMDAPNYPRGEQTNENTALLILGHPNANWGYAPLAAIYTPQQHEGGIHSNSSNPGGEWNDLLKAVANQAPPANPVERVYHDIHPKATDVVPRTTALRQALHRTWPDLDQIGGVYSVSQVMEGPARAASFAVNAAFAAAYANQSGKSAVVTSLANPNDAWAVLVAPPPGWHPSPPVTMWDRARGENRAYWPWFGARLP
ncbi:hypothetical protein LMG23992_03974 [Cupriavidus laharis]|uniref:Virulence factor n=1 Tax=Cupriavidus laharis TaxID=151654 RepID=A0ABM8XGM8_9BURK|nr:hypothetical protein [Cupriavidus laharis]CAG9179319.1 hypothetical protein LMG23992_03974 [Cupriavidus laharis]